MSFLSVVQLHETPLRKYLGNSNAEILYTADDSDMLYLDINIADKMVAQVVADIHL